jgi:hypothetical protein
MRPRGEIREALASSALALVPPDAPPGTGATWRELVRHALVGELMGRRTVMNMVRAGELLVVGTRKVPGVCRPVLLLAPRRSPAPVQWQPLAAAVQGWGPAQQAQELASA